MWLVGLLAEIRLEFWGPERMSLDPGGVLVVEIEKRLAMHLIDDASSQHILEGAGCLRPPKPDRLASTENRY